MKSLTDVTEPNADPTGQTTGGQLIVDSTHSYADLDELIVNHVQAMARRVEELMAHEKFKNGSEDDLRESKFSPINCFHLPPTRSFPQKLPCC